MSNAYKEVGTLKEIGAQVGDVVDSQGYGTMNVVFGVNPLGDIEMHAKSTRKSIEWLHGDYGHFRIISRAQTGPVRTVTTTRHDIVPGKYGNVTVWGDGWPSVKGVSNIDELTAAIDTLTAIRDAMQANTTS